ncbi:MAG: flippase-like domain-containing protein, partial [Candidatus Saccharimonadales bacterium]
IFTLGISTGTITPTPGGLGGFEAGLFAGFVAFHVPVAPALAIALLYRLISYWLALGIGLLAFIEVQRNHLFESK